MTHSDVESPADEDDPVLEKTDLAQQDFKAKLRYWREQGAPAYLGPRAVKENK